MEKPVVMMASLTSMSDVTAGSPYIFRYFLSSQDEVRRMTSYFKQKAIDKIGVLYINDDFGKDAFHLLKKLFKGHITTLLTYSKNTIANKIKESTLFFFGKELTLNSLRRLDATNDMNSNLTKTELLKKASAAGHSVNTRLMQYWRLNKESDKRVKGWKIEKL